MLRQSSCRALQKALPRLCTTRFGRYEPPKRLSGAVKRNLAAFALRKHQISPAKRIQFKRVQAIRNFCTTSRPLSWDTFRQDIIEIAGKMNTLAVESEGQLDRIMADALVSELVTLRRAHPTRRDELLRTDELEENAPSLDTLKGEEELKKDPLVERYELLLMLALESRDSKLALTLFDEIQQRHIQITPLMVNVVMEACLESGEVSKAKQIYEAMLNSAEAKHVTDLMTYYYAMRTYLSAGDERKMTEVYMELGKLANEREVRSDIVQRVVGLYVSGLTQIGFQTAGVNTYEHINRTNPEIVNYPAVLVAMAEAYSNLREHELVVSTFERLIASDAHIPYPSISRAILSFLCLKKDTKAQSLYEALQRMAPPGLKPWSEFVSMASSPDSLPKQLYSSEDPATLTLLKDDPSKSRYEDAIAHFALAGDLVRAETLLNEFLAKYPKEHPTLKMVTSLFQGGARLGNRKYLTLITNFQSNAKVPPSLARSILNFHIQFRDLDLAVESFYKITMRYPDSVTSDMCESLLTLVLSGLPSSGATDMESATKDSKSKVRQSLSTSPNAQVHTPAQERRLQTGIDLYYHITSTYPDTLLTVDFFNVALTLFTRDTHTKGVADVLEEIKRRSLAPNAGTYTSLMFLYLRRPDYNMVVQTYTQLIQKDLIPDTDTICALTLALGESKALANPKSVLFLREQLNAFDIMPDNLLLDTLKRAATKAGNPNAYGTLMRFLIHKFQLSLTAGNYNSWLSALLQCDQIPRAISLAETLLKEARKTPSLLTHGFTSQLALHISKEGGTDLNGATVERWISDPSSSKTVLSPQQRAAFEKDVSYWASLFPEDVLPSV